MLRTNSTEASGSDDLDDCVGEVAVEDGSQVVADPLVGVAEASHLRDSAAGNEVAVDEQVPPA